MRITVTKEDIQRGRPRSSSSCPIALALRRQTGVLYSVSTACAFTTGHEFRLPAEAMRFVDRFDTLPRSFSVPFTFDLPLPEPEPDIIQLLQQAADSEPKVENSAEVEVDLVKA